MPGGGKLLLKTGVVELRDHEVATLAAGRYAQVLVVDSGTGMSPEVLARAVEPFFTTKDVGRGTGLGLSQVHGFISQSGGDLVINSQPGQGTLVGIYLPLLDDTEQPAPPAPAQVVERVLIVEDEPELLALAANLFRSIGYDVLSASNAADARLIIERDPASVDVLFTDLVMPGTTGLELAEWVRETHPGIEVVLTSGYSTPDTGDERVRMADFSFVPKPYRLAELARALRLATAK
jgi:CheY-like chemotaxis protein